MPPSKLTVLGLESRAVSLLEEGNTYREIATLLSTEAKQKISSASVFRFFESRKNDMVEAVQKSDKLKSKLVEAEINTLQEALECIEDLRGICQEAKAAGDLKTAILAVDSIYKGLDMINKLLNKYQTTTNNQFNFTEVNIDSARERIISRLASLAPKE